MRSDAIWVNRLLILCGALFAAAPSSGQCSPQQVQTLSSPDGRAGDRFGTAVAISGDTAIVGAFLASTPKNQCGAAFVFVREHGQWVLQARLTASDARTDGRFGWSVAIDGDTALIGAAPGALPLAAYVFTRTDGDWTEHAKLSPPELDSGDGFGCSVGLAGNLAIVGAMWDDTPGGNNSGSASIFEREGDNWLFRERLMASDGNPEDRFGASVGVSGQSLVIGAPGFGGLAAYAFDHDEGGWTESLLVPPGAEHGDDFGQSVAIEGDRALVGAPGSMESGVVHMFTREQGVWGHSAEVIPLNDLVEDMGASVGFSGDVLLCGSPVDEEHRGSALLITGTGDPWIEQDRITPPGAPGEPGQFGHAVAIRDGVALVGAWLAPGPGGAESGLVYAIDYTCGPCYPDCDGVSGLNLFDFLCFVNSFNAGAGYADCDNSGALDLFDFLCFTNSFNAGC